MEHMINELIYIVLEKVLEAIYFSLFLIIGKNIKEKRLLLISIMILEYLVLTYFIEFNVWFQFIYTFMSFVNLKILYKEKAIITNIFLFAFASIFLIFFSILTYVSAIVTYENYLISLILNRILIFTFIFIFRNSIKDKYKEFCSLWNRHNHPNKIKSLTLRNISIITFNLMFWFINIGMLFFIIYLK